MVWLLKLGSPGACTVLLEGRLYSANERWEGRPERGSTNYIRQRCVTLTINERKLFSGFHSTANVAQPSKKVSRLAVAAVNDGMDTDGVRRPGHS